MRRIALHLLRVYRRDVSPGLNVECSLEPSCSMFATQAYERLGFVRATVATFRRLRECRRKAEGAPALTH